MRADDRSDRERRAGRAALVLAVDDEAEVLELLEETLQGLPIRLRCVGSAEEAIRVIDAEVPAVIVSDHGLPGMPGLQLLLRVRARWPRVGAILFTADAEARAGADPLPFPVLEKGSPAEAVRAAVSGLLADRHATGHGAFPCG